MFQTNHNNFSRCRGSAIAKIVGNNVLAQTDQFDTEVRMWVFEETVEGRKLTEIINNDHVNVKYLPGIQLPKNVVSVSECMAHKTCCQSGRNIQLLFLKVSYIN